MVQHRLHQKAWRKKQNFTGKAHSSAAEASCGEKKTQKTGEKTKPVFKRLFQATLGTKARKYPRTLKKKAAKESVAATKPAKRLRSKTTPAHLKKLKFHQGLKRLKSKKHLQATSEAGEFIFTSSSSRVVATSSLKAAEGEKPASPKVTQKNLPQKRLSSYQAKNLLHSLQKLKVGLLPPALAGCMKQRQLKLLFGAQKARARLG